MVAASVWQSYKAGDGKPYWFNTQTKQSVWEKPEELKSPLELALAELGWKQYESAGKPYYVNSATNETTWDVPADAKSKAEEKAATIAASRPVGAGSPNSGGAGVPPAANGSAMSPVLPTRPGSGAATPAAQAMSPKADQQPNLNLALAAPGQFGAGGAGSPYPGMPVPTHQVQQPREVFYETFEEAQEAFFALLKQHNVTPAWTWEQVLHATVTDPSFKALKTLQERKNAFETYCENIRKRERETKEKSMDRNRPAWRTALGRLSEGDYAMKSWWAWERAAREIRTQMPDVWAMARNDDERRALWQEYMHELDKKETARQKELRQSNIEKLGLVLKNLSLDLSVRFHAASKIIRDTKEWQEDTELQSMEPLDFLTVYEESVKKLEQETNQQKAKEKTERQRQIRKNREAYSGLLEELKSQGKIQAGTKWTSIFPLIKDDDRFIAMLANPGSTPLELFWDIVDDLDQKVEENTRVIENVMNERGVKVNSDSQFAAWDESLKDDARVSAIDVEGRDKVHQALLARIEQQAREERRRAERKLKHQIDDLRYALKDLEPPFEPTTSYQDAVPRMQDLPEFKALQDEEGRKSAYDRYIKRIAEKAEEEMERKRNRGYHSDTASHASRRTRHRSRLADALDAASPRGGESGRRGTPTSPARSRRDDRDYSPADRSRREKSRDRDGDGSRRDRRDRENGEDRDRHRSDRDGRSSRSHRDDDRKSSRRSSRRDEEEEHKDRRSDRARDSERDRHRDDREGDRDNSRRNRRRGEEEESGKERSSRPLEDGGELRESKRAKLDDKDKEEGEI